MLMKWNLMWYISNICINMINWNCSLLIFYLKKKSVNVLYCDIDCIYYNKKVYDIMFFLGRVLKSWERKNYLLKYMFIKYKKMRKGCWI